LEPGQLAGQLLAI